MSSIVKLTIINIPSLEQYWLHVLILKLITENDSQISHSLEFKPKYLDFSWFGPITTPERINKDNGSRGVC